MNNRSGYMRHAPAKGGFTLLEMLVAISLLALIALLATGSLRFGVRVWETGERAGERTRVAAVQRLLFQWLQEAEQMRMPDGEGDPLRGVFEGHSRALRFIGVQRGIGLPGGYYLNEFWLREEADGSHALVLRRRLVQPVERGLIEAAPEAEGGEARVLLEDVAALEIAYFGRETAAAEFAWLESWRSRLDLPPLVRIRLRFPEGDRRDWPELIVPLAMAG